MKGKTWMLNFIFAGIGAVLLVVAGIFAMPALEFLSTAVPVRGEVVANELDTGDGWRNPGYHCIFTFIDPSTKKKYRVRDYQRFNPALFSRGAKITVLVPPGRPNQTRVKSFRSLWLGPALLGGFGLGLIFVAPIAAAFDYYRNRYRNELCKEITRDLKR